MSKAIILFAHGARDPEWAAPVRRVQSSLRALAPAVAVEAAFLEFMSPNLQEAVEALAGQGCTNVVVVPMFIAQGGHLKRDVPAMIEVLGARFPELEIALRPAVGEEEIVIQAMAQAALIGVGL